MIFEGTKNQFFFGLGLTRAGESLPTVDNLYALSRLLHTSVDDILIGEKERDDEPSLSFSFYIFLWFSCPAECPFYILNFLICGRNRCVINHYGKTVNGCFFRY